MPDYQPMILKPAYQDYIWGGDRIIRHFQREEPDGIYAESWEVSDRPEGPSTVVNGPHAGTRLAELVARDPEGLVGRGAAGDRFPLLVKLIDAKQTLSVQVHPDDEAAAAFGGEAKTEMWYILQADPGAAVYAGFSRPIAPERVRQLAESGEIESHLQKVPVKAGDAVFTPGGRVHAIGAGCLILEIQQNSNTTYRIYDWGRVGRDGAPRPLHLEDAARVIRWDDSGNPLAPQAEVSRDAGQTVVEVLRCPYFGLERIDLKGSRPVRPDGTSWEAVFTASGNATLSWEGGEHAIRAGQTVLFPARGCPARWTAGESGAVLLRILPGA